MFAYFIKVLGLDAQERQLIARLQPGGGDGGEGGDRERALFTDAATGTEEETSIPRGDYGQFYSQIRDAVLGAGSNPVPPPQAIAVAAVIETAIRSASEGRTLTLALTKAESRLEGLTTPAGKPRALKDS